MRARKRGKERREVVRLEKRKERKEEGSRKMGQGKQGRGEHENEVGRVTVTITYGIACVKIQSP